MQPYDQVVDSRTILKHAVARTFVVRPGNFAGTSSLSDPHLERPVSLFPSKVCAILVVVTDLVTYIVTCIVALERFLRPPTCFCV